MTIDTTSYPTIFIKKREDRRIRQGGLWVYSNEIDTEKSPLASFTSGALVKVAASNGELLGVATINPNVLLTLRFLTRDPKEIIDAAFFKKRFISALTWRQKTYDKPSYRLIYGESDGLPGLIVDRFGEALSVQINTAGMEALKEIWLPVLDELLKPSTLYLGCESGYRQLEGLPLYSEFVKGSAADAILLEENNTHFEVSLQDGQKTGWFYDHRDNRARLQPWAKDKTILDVFSYAGGWGIQALQFGAAHALCIDSSRRALEQLKRNADRNQVSERIETLESDAFDALNRLVQEGKQFDMVVVDPPAFIKRRKDKQAGLNAYYRINDLAARLVKKDGLLVSCSCSMLLDRLELIDVIRHASNHTQREIVIVAEGHQSADHPVHPAIAETAYLKCFFSRVA